MNFPFDAERLSDKVVSPPMNGSGLSTLSSAMTDAVNYTRWVIEEFREFIGGRLMEVGLGYGGFLPFLAARDGYLGVDCDREVVELVSRSYPGTPFLVADVGDRRFAETMGDRRFDTVLCVNVLEHVQDDAAAIRNLLAVLERGGHLLLFVPAFEFLYTDLDRLAGHLRRYTRAGLLQRLPPEGVTVRRLEYFNPVGALGWWAQKLVSHESLEDRKVSSQVRMFDRYMVPVSRQLNRVTRRWFGQSLIGVVRKD